MACSLGRPEGAQAPWHPDKPRDNERRHNMEQYVKQPAEVEVFDLGGQTDMILRRDIQQTQQPLEDGGTQTIWTCEERQHRVPGSYTAEDVQADFDAWWNYVPPTPEPDDLESRILALLADAIREGVNEA